MFIKWTKFLILSVLAAALFYFLHKGYDGVNPALPPFGKLLDPYSGFWKNNTKVDEIKKEIELAGLQQQVTISWDDRRVPHIFAQNEYDLYFTQGYVTASNRLWQMDFITRIAAGRLAEVVGSQAIDFDRFNRRIGLSLAAQVALDTLQTVPDQFEIAQAYAAGVNAYIDELNYKQYPIEFKLLDYKPEKWSPYKSLLVLKYMAWDLNRTKPDKHISNARTLFGDSLFNELFPLKKPYYTPIIPQGKATVASQIVKHANSNSKQAYLYKGNVVEEKPKSGSNNWVISGKKTKSGSPILANDPHLRLNLPSIWYEIQLSTPGQNVYGVSLPGTPLVVIGFNEYIAWGFTYTASDPIDYYHIQQNADKTAYLYEDQWKTFHIVIDTIKVKNRAPVIDTIFYTHYGPLVYDSLEYSETTYNYMIPPQAAMRWTAFAPSLEQMAIHKLNKATNYNEYTKALQHFYSPGQNIVFASKTGDYALWHTGKFPIRSIEEGRFVNNGSQKKDGWQKFIPFKELPHVKNPAQGFVASANQPPSGFNHNYYLGADDYADFQRGNRINEVLAVNEEMTVFDMQRLQLDNKSVLAEMLLPTLFQLVDSTGLNPDEMDVYQQLKSWDYNYTNTSKSPVIFEEWLKSLSTYIWDDEHDVEEQIAWQRPAIAITTKFILSNPEASFFDDKSTSEKETLTDIVHHSFKNATTNLVAELGGLSEAWNWQDYRGTDIAHMANLKGFGRYGLKTGGSGRVVNATKGNHGPSWRMVVEMHHDSIRAFGVYPGGQSGHPGSAFYDSFVNDWVRGQYYPLLFLQQPDNELATTSLIPQK